MNNTDCTTLREQLANTRMAGVHKIVRVSGVLTHVGSWKDMNITYCTTLRVHLANTRGWRSFSTARRCLHTWETVCI